MDRDSQARNSGEWSNWESIPLEGWPWQMMAIIGTPGVGSESPVHPLVLVYSLQSRQATGHLVTAQFNDSKLLLRSYETMVSGGDHNVRGGGIINDTTYTHPRPQVSS